MWSLLQETPQYAISNPLDTPYRTDFQTQSYSRYLNHKSQFSEEKRAKQSATHSIDKKDKTGLRKKSLDILIRASRLKKVMTDKGKKSSMETFAPNDKADYYSGITSITVNRKNAYELKGKFLDDLHNNAFSGTNWKDAVDHIEYYLKIIDPIKLPNVDHDKLRVVVFPISLAGGQRR
ncbi:hypothetical protein Tco_1181838 [Tanacetum coccineum]